VLGASDLSGGAVARVVGMQPDALILDIGAPESFHVAQTLGIRLPSVKIVAFAVSDSDDLVLACAEAGYVSPDGSKKDLITAVQFALRGELYCSPRIAGLLFRQIGALSVAPLKPADQAALTQREQQIIRLVGEGMSNKEIGRVLRISDSTVKNHVHNILEKLQVRRRGEAVARLRSVPSALPTPNLGQRRVAGIPASAEPPVLPRPASLG